MEALLNDIEKLTRQYHELGIEHALNWEKFNHYSIVHHSTSIEGASLTEEETYVLLEEDITAKGKPLAHHLMQKDHLDALQFVLKAAEENRKVDESLLQEIAMRVMKNTGAEHHTIKGTFDSSKGELRLLNVTAGTHRFPDFAKVPSLLQRFCEEENKILSEISSERDILLHAFDAHFNLVSIHPYADGNGRVARLFMNFVQHKFKQPLTILFKEDKADYYKALQETRNQENPDVFRTFMLTQHQKQLTQEINKAIKATENKGKKSDNGYGMTMLF